MTVVAATTESDSDTFTRVVFKPWSKAAYLRTIGSSTLHDLISPAEASMLAIQLPSSVPAGIVQHKRIMREALPPIPQLRYLEQNARSEHIAARTGGVGYTVSATQAGDTATIYHGLRTPPLEPHDMNVNPLLAPSYGPLHYKGVPVVASNTASHQHSLSSVGNARYTSKVPPLPESYKPTHRSQGSICRSENDENREHTHRGRNNDGTDIAHYLQIPPSINDSKGSLAEFAAQV